MQTPNWIKEIKTPKVNPKNYLSIYSPLLAGNEKKYLNQCLETGWLSPKGDYVARFEKKFADYCGSPYALACASGTSAIYLSLLVLGIKKSNEVIIPTLTMVSTALAVCYTGAKPVFVDSRSDTGNIDVEKIEKAITKKTKAIIPVHLYGNPANMEEIKNLAQKHHLYVIEDAAETIGASYQGKKIGNYSLLTAFSLYINKVVTTGQGGMITVSSRKLYQELKKLNNYYFSPVRHFWHQKIGYNFKLSNLQAAVGLAQMEHIEEILDKKKQISDWYRESLYTLSGYFIPLPQTKNAQTNHWMTAYRLTDPKFNIMKLRRLLAKNGIETRSFFIPLHLQPIFWKKEYEGRFPHAEFLAQTGVLLPSGPTLKQSDVERICSVIHSYFKK